MVCSTDLALAAGGLIICIPQRASLEEVSLSVYEDSELHSRGLV